MVTQGIAQDIKSADLDGVTLEYFDTGGEKTPLLFIHGDSRDINQYNEFITNFTDSHRVISYSRRGYGNSKAATSETGKKADAEDLMKLMDYLEVEKAIFIGNSYAGILMTYLAENHSDRNIAQIYLAGNPGFNFHKILTEDPLDAHKMMLWAQGGEEYAYDIIESSAYQPEFVTKGTPLPDIPALGFLNNQNMRGIENMNMIMLYSSAPERIQYEEPKAFFEKLAADPEMQKEVNSYFEESVKPNLILDNKKWLESFPSLKIVNLDIPRISGYEFEMAPELIVGHIQEFLETLE